MSNAAAGLFSSQPVWAAAGWLFFRVAHSSRINSDMLVARALQNSQLTGGESHAISGTGH
jgi:hypothetical protein